MIRPFFHFDPFVPASAYVDKEATVIGRVVLGEHASIWPGAVLRGDINSITVGDYSNIQDNSVLHVGDHHCVVVGKEVVVGHAARLHGCTIQDGCLIGIGCVVLNGVVVGEHCILAAGTLVPERMVLEPRGLYLGSPARLKRLLEPAEIAGIRQMARKYAFIASAYRDQEEAVAKGKRLGKGDWEKRLEAFREGGAESHHH